jgi:hypothetical protein
METMKLTMKLKEKQMKVVSKVGRARSYGDLETPNPPNTGSEQTIKQSDSSSSSQSRRSLRGGRPSLLKFLLYDMILPEGGSVKRTFGERLLKP